MRIGSTVLLSMGKCIQSYNWTEKRPLGSLQGVIDSLEEYQCDEIAIIRPVRKDDTLSQFKNDLARVKKLNTMTPISFGGGIRSHEHIKLLRDLPIERLAFSSAFINRDYDLVKKAIELFGRQAIQCILPLAFKNNDKDLVVFNSSNSSYVDIEKIELDVIASMANEVIVIDSSNEGEHDKFNWSLLDSLTLPIEKIVISGGIDRESLVLARQKNIASVLIDNKVLHKEYSILGHKHAKKMS